MSMKLKVLCIFGMICELVVFTAISLVIILAGVFADNLLLGIVLIVVPFGGTYILGVVQILHYCKTILCAKD